MTILVFQILGPFYGHCPGRKKVACKTAAPRAAEWEEDDPKMEGKKVQLNWKQGRHPPKVEM